MNEKTISIMLAACLSVLAPQTVHADDKIFDLQLDKSGDTTLTSIQISIPVYLKSKSDGSLAGIMALGCNTAKKQMSISFSMNNSYSVFDDNKDRDTVYFSTGKDFPPYLFMKSVKGELTSAVMISAASSVAVQDQSYGWNDYSSVAIAMDIISDNKTFTIFSNSKASPSRRMNIITADNSEFSKQAQNLFRHITDTCKGQFNIHF